jgi:hypothetical protein
MPGKFHDRNTKALVLFGYIMKILQALALIFILAIVGVIVFFLFNCKPIKDMYEPLEFNKADWHTDGDKRLRMAVDILNKKMFIGKSREETLSILGGVEDQYEYERSGKKCLRYIVCNACQTCFSYGTLYLELYFTDDKVEKVVTYHTNF